MSLHKKTTKVLAHPNLRHFFQDSIEQAMHNQKIETDAATTVYLVNLLTSFTRSENLFERTEDGLMLKPLALHYHDAINATTKHSRYIEMQRLGDIALFISGIFSHSLARKLVDIDYYINMGGNAYSYLAEFRDHRLSEGALGDIYTELASKFVSIVDVLNEVGEGIQSSSHTDLLRLYEIWLNTGSKRAEKLLRQHGMHPCEELTTPFHH